MELGENGEAFYNKDIFKILRYIREKLPAVNINMSNNFTMMSEEAATIILTEKLFDGIQVNIDGHNAETYTATKLVNYGVVIRNLKRFIEIRNTVYPEFKLSINVMPLFEYLMAVRRLFDADPHSISGEVPYSSYEEIVESLKEFVPANVPIMHSSPGMWAERSLIRNGISKIDQTPYSCPILWKVTNEAHIAPNGDWYACCLDDDNDLVWGNVATSTLVEVHESETRSTHIARLKARKFEEIGYPCNTVVCCQSVHDVPNTLINQMFKKGDVIVLKKQ